jgi:hypothetical protein
MRSGITQFTIRTVVAIGIAVVGATAIGVAVADSAFERAQVIARFTKPPGLSPRFLVFLSYLAAVHPSLALEIGARLPTEYGESVVVRNDGGVRNATTHFPYGAICHTDIDLKTWLVVKRIVGGQVLIELDLDFDLTMYGRVCPHRTETSMPLAQAQRRFDDFVRA